MSGREHHNQWRIQDFGEGGGAFPPGGKGGGVASPLVRNININNRLCKKKIKNVK